MDGGAPLDCNEERIRDLPSNYTTESITHIFTDVMIASPRPNS